MVVNRPTAERANFESSVGLVFNLLSIKVFDKNRTIWKYEKNILVGLGDMAVLKSAIPNMGI